MTNTRNETRCGGCGNRVRYANDPDYCSAACRQQATERRVISA